MSDGAPTANLAEYQDLIQAAARSRLFLSDYMTFVHGWKPRAHQRPWVDALQALRIKPPCFDDGCFVCRVHKERRLLIVAAPGWGKTDTLIEFVSWVIGRESEDAAVGFFSYNDNIATERSMAVRDVVWSNEPTEIGERYGLVFPSLKPAKDRPWSQERWYLARKDKGKKDPTLVASGIEGSVNARRLSGLVLDDPHNRENSKTAHMRAQVRSAYNLTARTRLLADGWQVCISGRWAEDDLAGYFIDQGWPVLRTPALNELNQCTWPYEGTNLGFRADDLVKLRADDPHSFLLQYQGVVTAPENEALLPMPTQTWELPGRFASIVQSWDTALGTGAANSETACITLGKAYDGRLYILDAWADHISFNELMNVVLERYEYASENWGEPRKVLVEEASTGGPLIQQLRYNTALPVQGVYVGGRGRTKEERIAAVSKLIETHVVVPAAATWKQKLIGQLLSYPEGKDDLLMALVQALHDVGLKKKVEPVVFIKPVRAY